MNSCISQATLDSVFVFVLSGTVGSVGQKPCSGDQGKLTTIHSITSVIADGIGIGVDFTGSGLVCYDPTTNSHYLAGLVSFGSVSCGRGLGGQNTKIANFLPWILQIAATGNHIATSDGSAVVSPPQMAVNQSPNRQAVSPKACGLPGNGAVDPFGIVSQFSTTAKSFNRRLFPGGESVQRIKILPSARIIGGFDAPAAEICWQVRIMRLSSTNICAQLKRLFLVM